LYVAHAMAFGLAFLVLMLAASEVGFRLGRRPNQQKRENAKSQISAIEAGILGVLGLLLGFTMSMAVGRFEMRKQLVLEEANAIRDAHLRTQLLPSTEGHEIADLLRAYVNVRIPSDTDRPVYDHMAAAQQEAVRLQNAFWQRAVAYGQRHQHPELASL